MSAWTLPVGTRQATEAQVVAMTLWAEARNEAQAGLEAVASVLENRRRSRRYGATLKAVCLAPWQFSCWTPAGGRRNHEFLLVNLQRLLDKVPLDKLDTKLLECLQLAEVMQQTSWIPPLDADHYCTVDLLHQAPPVWTRDQAPVAIIGRHAFFKLL